MIKHNKKKNAYLVYEQLAQIAARLTAKKKVREAGVVIETIKKFYNKSTNLSKEKMLFESVLGAKGMKEDFAKDVLSETLSKAKTINLKELEKEKHQLINYISENLSKDLFDVSVKAYKPAASLQVLFNDERQTGTFISPEQKVRVKNQIISKMIEKPIVENREVVDSFTLKLAVDKFNKKYSQLLNEDQQDILKAWSTFLSKNDRKALNETLKAKVLKVRKVLLENTSHKEFGAQIKEAYSASMKMNLKEANEEFLYELMRYYDLVEDLQAGE